jgi:hypothetical protein
MLYAGTVSPIPRKDWSKEAPSLWVRSLVENEEPIRVHFSRPEVQFIGSTSSCGCDFPHAMFQNGYWPEADITPEERDEEYEVSCRNNREALAELLASINESHVELYGIWAGSESEKPLKEEDIPLEAIKSPGFRLKEGGFYVVDLTPAPVTDH